MEFMIKKDRKTKPFHRHWQFCVGSGHALLALRTDYTRQLKWIHDELGIQYVRFHGIFNDDMHTLTNLEMFMPVPGAKAYQEQNFHACGIAYDNVLAAGMKPFVELSFMPKMLASGEAQCMFFYGGNVTVPAKYQAWRSYIQDFIRYLLHRYGKEEVRSWYFEVWNEPDLNPVFFSGSQKDYFRLYEETVRAIKEVDAALRVGGPATSGSKWIKEFVEYCEEHQVPADFVSTHQYAGDPLAGVDGEGAVEEATEIPEGVSVEELKQSMGQSMAAALSQAKEQTFLAGWRALMPDKSETEEIPDDVFRRNAAFVRSQAGKLPVYYTEWNENAIFGARTNDTRKVAAYDVKAALEVENLVDGSSVWCFSDIFEEMHQFAPEFHGGFGMLTLNGIPKPVFYGMKMLEKVGDERIDLGEKATFGEVGIAAFQSDKGIQILLFRQKMKNLDLPKEHVSVRVELDAEPQDVLLERIDEEHCNPLKIWEEQGCPADLNAEEVKAIIEESAMKEEKMEYRYEENMLCLDANLGVNDVYLIQIRFENRNH